MERCLYPMMMDISRKEVVVVGGGRVAERKIRDLVKCDASVTVISPEVTEPIEKMVERGFAQWLKREFDRNDLEHAFMVIAATDNRVVNHKISQICDYEGILVNRVDQPEASDFISPSVVRRGRLTIAVSTDGAAPSVSRRITEQLGEQFGFEYAAYLSLLDHARQTALKSIPEPSTRRAVLKALADDEELLRLVADRKNDEAQARADAMLADAQTEDGRQP